MYVSPSPSKFVQNSNDRKSQYDYHSTEFPVLQPLTNVTMTDNFKTTDKMSSDYTTKSTQKKKTDKKRNKREQREKDDYEWSRLFKPQNDYESDGSEDFSDNNHDNSKTNEKPYR
ncbi:hypothetical protein evm_013643 [Chilo suppressalis]|nr:hypothetical protein evm_013643 [Chilo suppressalis]